MALTRVYAVIYSISRDGTMRGRGTGISTNTGVLAGADIGPDALSEWARSADVVIAADGAADRLLACGVTPDVTIGDMDSLGSRDGLPRVIDDPDQSTSDADKLLKFAASSGYSGITLIGLEGDRLDHVLATLGSLVRTALAVRVVLRTGLGWVVRGGDWLELIVTPGDTVSLIPLVGCSGVVLSGVRWPLSAVAMAPDGLVSLSNRAVGDRVKMSIGSGAALLVRLCSIDPVW